MLTKIRKKVINLLRWSEQYTKTDMVYLAKGGFWVWLGKGITVLTSLALAVAFANLIDSDTYGTYKYVLSLASVMSMFTLTGLGKAITRAIAQGFEGMYQKGVRVFFKWSFGIVLVAGSSAAYYLIQGNQEIGISLLLVATLYPVIKTSGLYTSFLEGKKDFKTRSIYLAIRETIQAGVLVLLMLATPQNTILLICGLLVSNALLNTFFYFYTKHSYQLNDQTDESTITYGKHLSVIRIIRAFAGQVDKILIFQSLGSTPLAIYSFAQIPTKKADSFLRSIGSIILPKFSEKSLKTLQRTITHKVLIFLGVCVVGVGAFILAAPYIYQLLFPEYVESIRYARWFSLLLLAAPEILYGQALYAHALKKELYFVGVGSDILKLLLLVVLLPIYGVMGAIAAIVVTHGVRFCIKAIYFYTADQKDNLNAETGS